MLKNWTLYNILFFLPWKKPMLFHQRRWFAVLNQSTTGMRLTKTPKELAERTLTTQLLLTRWALETTLQQTNDKQQDTQKAFDALSKCISHHSVDKYMTEKEKVLFGKSLGINCILIRIIGSWDQPDSYETEIQWESLGMLLW
jgi:hypothetical protein